MVETAATGVAEAGKAFLDPARAAEEQGTVVAVEHVGLCYPRPVADRPTAQAKRLLSILWRGERTDRDNGFWAVKDASFRVRRGEAVAIVGLNGSGKSTLVRIIAGIYKPNRGSVTVTGRTALLSRGLGFRDQLSGRENILINAGYLGLTRREAAKRVPRIAEFAELGQFIDQPIKTYSSGMKGRLGFSIATAIDPEILIMDEALSAGDPAFRAKAKERLKSFIERAQALIFVSHSESFVRQTATRVIWMDQGVVRQDGPTVEVMAEYMKFCAEKNA